MYVINTFEGLLTLNLIFKSHDVSKLKEINVILKRFSHEIVAGTIKYGNDYYR